MNVFGTAIAWQPNLASLRVAARGIVVDTGSVPHHLAAGAHLAHLPAAHSSAVWAAAHTWSGQYALRWHIRAGRRCLVRLGEPDPRDANTWGIDPEQIEISTLAALERAGTDYLDRVELPGVCADAVIVKENIAALRELRRSGLIGSWSLRARTAKQYMRALSFLGIEHLSVDRSVLETVELSALLAAAERARVQLTLNLPPSFQPAQVAQAMLHPQVEVVFGAH